MSSARSSCLLNRATGVEVDGVASVPGVHLLASPSPTPTSAPLYCRPGALCSPSTPAPPFAHPSGYLSSTRLLPVYFVRPVGAACGALTFLPHPARYHSTLAFPVGIEPAPTRSGSWLPPRFTPCCASDPMWKIKAPLGGLVKLAPGFRGHLTRDIADLISFEKWIRVGRSKTGKACFGEEPRRLVCL
ncbi:hypothetical protein FA13DRAFT_1090746 [Coprinellus micaceus]|uniref:Uncharacterized protein n=1 Tax=Coprinellus micaceus TaxID=71717 RepID=A0A4Y7TRV9_COPMI|nr:hypothetical protein FA13DRAFT_1090746 [Coprinellus micaceus]